MNPVTLVISVHAFCGIFALAAGYALFFQPKRTQLHKRLGHYYAAALIAVDLTGWLLYFLRGSSINAFHVLAIANLFALTWGISAAIRRQPTDKWYRHHYYLISWSYVGLIAAILVEFAVKVAQLTSFSAIAAVTLSTCITGGTWIEWKSRRLGDISSRPDKLRPLQAV